MKTNNTGGKTMNPSTESKRPENKDNLDSRKEKEATQNNKSSEKKASNKNVKKK